MSALRCYNHTLCSRFPGWGRAEIWFQMFTDCRQVRWGSEAWYIGLWLKAHVWSEETPSCFKVIKSSQHFSCPRVPLSLDIQRALKTLSSSESTLEILFQISVPKHSSALRVYISLCVRSGESETDKQINSNNGSNKQASAQCFLFLGFASVHFSVTAFIPRSRGNAQLSSLFSICCCFWLAYSGLSVDVWDSILLSGF